MQQNRQKKTKPAKQRKEKRETRKSTPWLCLLRGLAIAFAITCIIFIGFGILLTYTELSEDVLPMVSLGCSAVSAAAAGFDWGSCMGQKGLLWGLLAGAAYTAILFLVTGLAGNGVQIALSGLMTLIVAMAGGGIGGILGVNKKP